MMEAWLRRRVRFLRSMGYDELEILFDLMKSRYGPWTAWDEEMWLEALRARGLLDKPELAVRFVLACEEERAWTPEERRFIRALRAILLEEK